MQNSYQEIIDDLLEEIEEDERAAIIERLRHDVDGDGEAS